MRSGLAFLKFGLRFVYKATVCRVYLEQHPRCGLGDAGSRCVVTNTTVYAPGSRTAARPPNTILKSRPRLEDTPVRF